MPTEAPKPELTGEEALAILRKAETEGHLPQGYVERELAAIRQSVVDETHGCVEAAVELPKPIELTPEVLAQCLAGLEKDYKRGIVVVDKTKGLDDFRAALKEDKTAGTPWGTISGKLEADDGKLLKLKRHEFFQLAI